MIYNQSALTIPTYITGGEPVNAAVVNRLVQNSGGLVTRVSELSNNLTVTSGNSDVTIIANRDVLILCNNTVDITVTLPAASTQYKRITIKKTANNTNTVTIQRAGSDTIEDPTNPLTTPIATSFVLYTADSSVSYNTSGNTWRINDLYITPEAWTTPTLQNSWVAYSGGFNAAQYSKTGTGWVYLRGLIRDGTTTGGTLLFTLPTGYRPINEMLFSVANSSGYSRVNIRSTGDVIVAVCPGNDWQSLDSISFRLG